ncbi:MAG: DUF1365 domain-containing protein [Pseudonocardia sp.]|nr:DUF1365 domain-containing protein [Pseudonocardia sp.]
MSGAGRVEAQRTTRAPAIYDSVVRHVRRKDQDYRFSHPIYLWLVDLDAMPRLPAWLRPFAGFRAKDHLGDPDATIRQNVDAYLALHGIDLRGGQVLMLAHARVLGHVFNPISVFWCRWGGGENHGGIACVIAEVHNTYRERHCYLLYPDPGGRAGTEKDFYVSPFLTVDGQYSMLLREPADRLAVSITLRQDDEIALTATLIGARRPATTREVLRTVLRRPLVTQRTSALIRRHGIALWLRRLPVVPRPTHRPQKGVTR